MNDLFAFLAGSCIVIWLSRKPLLKPGSHGFYRFFAWEAILGLIVLNHSVWGADPYSPHQFTSWILMLLSIFLVIAGVSTLKSHGAGRLITSGPYRHIRHPMYSSLLALAWGAFFQRPSMIGAIIACIASVALWLTAVTDERECLAYFGDTYADYMQRTKRFIPFLL